MTGKNFWVLTLFGVLTFLKFLFLLILKYTHIRELFKIIFKFFT